MKLFLAALLVVACAGAALARPEESAAPVELPSAPAEQPEKPALQPSVPAVAEPSASAQKPSKPVLKPTKPGSLIESILSHVKELIGKFSHALSHGKGSATRAAVSVDEKKKKTLAKIEALKAELQQKDKTIVVPASPKDKRDSALALKKAISNAIQELDAMKAEIMRLK